MNKGWVYIGYDKHLPTPIQLKHFEVGITLVKGAFSRARFVKHKVFLTYLLGHFAFFC